MKEKIKTALGKLLIKAYPRKANNLSQSGMTISWNNKLSIVERLMRQAMLKQAEADQDFDTLALFHNHFWTERGDEHFSHMNNTLKGFFKPKAEFMFDLLKEITKESSHSFNTMLEIGTGDGSVLNYLSSKFPEINSFIGIDLSKDQIDKNRKCYVENPKLEFTASDGSEWIKKNGSDNMVVFTCGGVLEYFTQKKLEELFSYLKSIHNIIIITIEPIGTDIDFDQNPNSQPYGPERSFSHNYIKLFEDAGFNIWHESKIECENEEWDFIAVGVKNFK